MRRTLLLLFALVAVGVGATMLYLGQRGPDGAVAAQPAPPAGPSGEMMAAMHRMHEAADKAPMTGDIDRDYIALMVPHHQSAVEMARVYLEHGKDPELRRLSENVIASQEAEIRLMNGRAAAPATAGKADGAAHQAH
ncbi:MAG: DUF305 domain-containing protein [Allosphingosinicella sp.]